MILLDGSARSRANGSFPMGAGRLSEKSPAGYPHLAIGRTPPGSAGVPTARGQAADLQEDTPRERGRPARILSLCLALSFPAMRQQATLPAGTPWAQPKQSHGAAAGRPGWRRWARLCQDLCGRDARAPGWASSHDIVTPREHDRRSIRAPLVIEGGPFVFVLIRVHWWFFFPSMPIGLRRGPTRYSIPK